VTVRRCFLRRGVCVDPGTDYDLPQPIPVTTDSAYAHDPATSLVALQNLSLERLLGQGTAAIGTPRMMWNELLTALSLALVLEGILPFVNPPGAREAFAAMASMDDKMLRSLGFASMLIGSFVLYLVR
jgi:uncharacterized protein